MFDVRRRADGDFAACPGRQVIVVGAKDRDLDERPRRTAGRFRLGRVAGPEIDAADGVGLGQAVAKPGLSIGECPLEPLDVADRPRRAAGGVSLNDDRSYLARRMVEKLQAHGRDADEVRDLPFAISRTRLARIPLGHHHHAAADD